MWEGVTVVRKCDRRFVSSWDWSWGVKGFEEVQHLTESVTVSREV